MERYTKVNITANYPKIDYHSKVLLIGSCFSEHIGKQLERAKVPTLNNPFGITFNPLSIAEQISILLDDALFPTGPLPYHDELFFHFSFHGAFNDTNEQRALQHMQRQVEAAREYLKTATHLILTPGTSFVWYAKGIPVNNCHKLPKSQFAHNRISVAEMHNKWSDLLKRLMEQFPNLKIITTVSPVRHPHAGFIENTRSKATLIAAIDSLEQQFSSLYYFPSYEIVLDELRDYRYFAKDMLHPNEEAIAIVWMYFKASFFTKETLDILREIENIQLAVHHRPLFPTTEKHKKFIEKTKRILQNFKQKYPAISMESEEAALEFQLSFPK